MSDVRTLLIPDRIWTTQPDLLVNLARITRRGVRFSLERNYAVVTVYVDETNEDAVDFLLSQLDRETALQVA